MKKLVFVIFVSGLIASSYIAGFVASDLGWFPKNYTSRLADWIRPRLGHVLPQQGPLELATVDSIFFPIKVSSVDVPPVRQGAGGGLTSFGDELLLVNHEGRFFLHTDELTELSIEAPDNGLDAYREISASEEWQNVATSFSQFRYNDLLISGNILIISYTEWIAADACYGTTIATVKLSNDLASISDLSITYNDWRVVYRTQPCLPLKRIWRSIEGHMAGGRMVALDADHIILASADYSWDGMYAPEVYAQVPDNDYGKVLKINIHEGSAETVSIGNRNMQGIAIDTDRDIWVVSHGARGGDELNLILQGKNYGWPLEAYGTRYNALRFPEITSYGHHDQHTRPVYAWLPSVAPSGMTVINGFHPAWEGDFLVGTFRGELYRLRIREDRVVFAEVIDLNIRARYVHQHEDGRLVVWSDDQKLYFLEPEAQDYSSTHFQAAIRSIASSPETQSELERAVEFCQECHSLDSSESKQGPGLAGVIGSIAGNAAYDGYSSDLRNSQLVRTRGNLLAYIRSPQTTISGTTMSETNLSPAVADSVIEVIDTLAEIERGKTAAGTRK